MIILDTNSLVRLLVQDLQSDDYSRLLGLLETAKTAGLTIGIPAPVFAEFLVRADEATADMLDAFERKQNIKVLPFDKRAAHECAILDRVALASGQKKGSSRDAWQKVKIDRQILAIARVHAAVEIISSDANLLSSARRVGIRGRSVADLPIRKIDKQGSLPLPSPENT